MTSERKAEANRENAQASTGPKTSKGRARSARNALRHALSRSVHSNPEFSDDVKILAREIAGPEATVEIEHLARQVAESQIDLRRVRYAYHQLLSNALRNPYYDRRARVREKTAVMISLLRATAPDIQMETLVQFLTSTPVGPQKLATILLEEGKELQSMDRYERRALSRRKFAIRALDEARRRTRKID